MMKNDWTVIGVSQWGHERKKKIQYKDMILKGSLNKWKNGLRLDGLDKKK